MFSNEDYPRIRGTCFHRHPSLTLGLPFITNRKSVGATAILGLQLKMLF
jgi:hypothetical protein